MSEYDWMDENTKALINEPMHMSRYLLYAIVVFIVLFIIWANMTEVDERTKALGKVIPTSQVQEIQSLEGGILEKLFVHEGEIVQEGQLLLKIDDTKFSSDFLRYEVNYYGMLAKEVRLNAEANNDDQLDFPKELIEEYADVVATEQELFSSNRQQLKSQLETLNKSLQLATKRLEIAEKAVIDNVISQTDYLQLQQEVNELQGEYNDAIKSYTASAHSELVEVRGEINSLKEALAGYEDTVNRSTMRSPVYGIVKRVNIGSVGGVIDRGENILEIIPLEDKLLIQARVNPKDIAFIRAEQRANVVVTAYDPSVYGSLKGVVRYVSADAIIDTNDQGRPETYYKVNIETEASHLAYHGKELPIIPGMQADISILTGRKSIMDYLLKPILKVRQEALSER